MKRTQKPPLVSVGVEFYPRIGVQNWPLLLPDSVAKRRISDAAVRYAFGASRHMPESVALALGGSLGGVGLEA